MKRLTWLSIVAVSRACGCSTIPLFVMIMLLLVAAAAARADMPENFGRPANMAEKKAVVAKLIEQKLINPTIVIKSQAMDDTGKVTLALGEAEVGWAGTL